MQGIYAVFDDNCVKTSNVDPSEAFDMSTSFVQSQLTPDAYTNIDSSGPSPTVEER